MASKCLVSFSLTLLATKRGISWVKRRNFGEESTYIKKVLPTFNIRAMRKQIQEKFGRLSNKVKPHEFRFIYKELTGDCSEGSNLTEKEIDQRVKEFIDVEDLAIIPDLCTHNKGRQNHFGWHVSKY